MATPQEARGFEYDKFVQPPSEHLKCPICGHILRSAHFVDCCSRNFCHSCLQQSNPVCPLCQRRYSASRNAIVDREVSVLQVWCPYKPRGCEWVGGLGHCQEHVNKCAFSTVVCGLGCGEKVQQRLMQKHCELLCPLRAFDCHYCRKYVSTYRDVEKHWEKCEYFPIPCPNDCPTGSVPRNQLMNHLKKECKIKEQLAKARSQRRELAEKLRKMEEVRSKPKQPESQLQAKTESQLRSELERKRQEIHTLTTQKKQLDNQLKEARSRISNLELAAKHQSNKTELLRLKSDTQQAQEDRQAELSKMEADLHAQKQKNAELEGTVSEMEARMTQLEQQLQDKETEISQVIQAGEKVGRQVNSSGAAATAVQVSQPQPVVIEERVQVRQPQPLGSGARPQLHRGSNPVIRPFVLPQEVDPHALDQEAGDLGRNLMGSSEHGEYIDDALQPRGGNPRPQQVAGGGVMQEPVVPNLLQDENTTLDWKRYKDLPTVMFDGSAVLVGDYVYAGGGKCQLMGNYSNECTVFRYNPSSNTWQALQPKVNRHKFTVVEYQNQLVLVGGATPGQMLGSGCFNTLLLWDEARHAWTTPYAPMITARKESTAMGYKHYILVAGGVNQTELDSVEMYDGDKNQWYMVAHLPVRVRCATSAVWEGSWYIMGGYGLRRSVYSISLEALIREGDRRQRQEAGAAWKSLPIVPFEHSTAAVFGRSLLSIGGVTALGTQNAVHAYFPGMQRWLEMSGSSLPRAVSSAAAVAISARELLVVGGCTKTSRCEFVCKASLKTD